LKTTKGRELTMEKDKKKREKAIVAVSLILKVLVALSLMITIANRIG
jgi:hypothetical protein